MAAPALLALDGITKRFGAVAALDGASLGVAPGTVHALLGENGAGKTTLMRIAFGMLRPDAGVVRVDGREARLGSPAEAIARGVGMVHQHFTNVPAMTVAENVALGGRGRYDRRRAAERVREIGEATGLVIDPDALVDELPVGAQQRLEIVKALARDARVLILDEPTAVLAPAEADDLLRWVRAFVAGGARAVVLITHKLREALAVSDEITVLRAGRTVLHDAAGSVGEEDLVRAMVGVGAEASAARGAPPERQDRAANGAEPHQSDAPGLARNAGDVVLAADGVGVVDARGVVRLRDATVEVRAGEIVGVAGVEGAGQRELLRLLAGRLAPTSGTVRLPASVGFVPEDRHRDALVLGMRLDENVALRGAGGARGVLRWPALRARAAALLGEHDVRAAGPAAAAWTLSGGNQQKLVLARELDGPPAALVAENPTRGLDIRATAAVRDRLRAARDAGLAVALYSSDLDELLALADRVVVAHAGRVHAAPRDRGVVGRVMLTGM